MLACAGSAGSMPAARASVPIPLRTLSWSAPNENGFPVFGSMSMELAPLGFCGEIAPKPLCAPDGEREIGVHAYLPPANGA